MKGIVRNDRPSGETKHKKKKKKKLKGKTQKERTKTKKRKTDTENRQKLQRRSHKEEIEHTKLGARTMRYILI